MLSSRIKELRLSKNLTMLQLGKMIHIGESTISLYESGKRQPSYDVLLKLSAIFDVSLDYLLCKTDDPASPDAKKDRPTDERSIELDSIRENLERLNSDQLNFIKSFIGTYIEQQGKKKNDN